MDPAAAGHGHRHRCRRRDAELLLELLDELRQLEHRDPLDVFDYVLLRQCHDSLLLKTRLMKF